jgi:hypothetical protein
MWISGRSPSGQGIDEFMPADLTPDRDGAHVIDQDERRALTALLSPDRAANRDDAWTDLDAHLDELHEEAAGAVRRALEEAAARRTGSPPGLVVAGEPGSGKTHLLRWAREAVQQQEGYFFLVGDHSSWPGFVRTFLQGLRLSGHYRHTQLAMFLERLSERAELPSALHRRIRGQAPLTPEALDAFVTGVRTADPEAGRDCRLTLRALVLLAAADPGIAELGESWLLSRPEPGAADQWALPRIGKSEQDIAVEISRLLALTGPSMLAADGIVPGLTDLHEKLFRTVTIVTGPPASGEPVDRVHPLRPVPSREVAERLIATRFAPLFEAAEFEPPHPTWPILPQAFSGAVGRTPRALIERVDEHVRYCLARDEIIALSDLDEHHGSPAPLPAAGDQSLARPVAGDQSLPRPAAGDQSLPRPAAVTAEEVLQRSRR